MRPLFVRFLLTLALIGCGAGPSANARTPSQRPTKQGEGAARSAQGFDVFAHDEPTDDPREPLPVARNVRSRASLSGVNGRALVNLSVDACYARLRELGVRYERGRHSAAPGGVIPTAPVGGVEIAFTGRRRQGRILDCRLVLALHAWAPLLRELGVRRVRHLSGLRPGAVVATTGRPSGHRYGYAFDPRFFDYDDGTTFDVLEDWEDRTRGAPLCEEKREGARTANLRAAVCAAIEAGLFQVVVSPHHNDAHQNHLHLEVVPGARWNWAG